MTIPGEELLGFFASPLDKFFEKDPKEPSASGKSRKPGPHTIADNFLLGKRNWWVGFFEEHWPGIGWSLLSIRDKQKPTHQDVQEAFKPLEGRPNCEMAAPFWNRSVLPTSKRELRENRVRHNQLQYAVQDMRSKREEQIAVCAQAETALRQAKVKERAIILPEAKRRKLALAQVEKELRAAEEETDSLGAKVRDQEAFWYCSQLLDFLQSRTRAAVKPLNVGNALAGLPDMAWRQSIARCTKMPYDSLPRFPYAVFKIISEIWSHRRVPLREDPVEFFRFRLLALPKRYQYTREQLWEAWRDLRLAIDKCRELRISDPRYPFSLTSTFLRNLFRQKSTADQILDTREKLNPDVR